ncbi:MAG: dockerin type I repeat-containing protein [Ruminococcus sp.]|nr:dockerin type I repeat-containing protein [Ruminococcus sp.]
MKYMMKMIAGLVSAVILASVSAVSASAAAYYPEVGGGLHGDVDGNGAVNGDDLDLLKNAMLGYRDPRVTPMSADVNEDGSVSILDVVMLMKILKADMHCTDGINSKYQFTCNGRTFTAVYTENKEKGLYNWKITDSYQITKTSDMLFICRLLAERHPIPTAALNGMSFRSADNMAMEWDAHNYVYGITAIGSSWNDRAKDVDIDPTGDGMNRNNFFFYL